MPGIQELVNLYVCPQIKTAEGPIIPVSHIRRNIVSPIWHK